MKSEGMLAVKIIEIDRQQHLADNSDRFTALSSVFDNVEYPKDFKPTNIQKYDGKCWYFLTFTERIRKRTEDTDVALHPESIQGIVFPQGTDV